MRENFEMKNFEEVLSAVEEKMHSGAHSRECAPTVVAWFDKLPNKNLSMESLAFMVETDDKVATAIDSRHPGVSKYFATAMKDYLIDNRLRALQGL